MEEKKERLDNGKLPHQLLTGLLARFTSTDDTVVIGPGVGCDAAAITVGDDFIATVTSDPITFTDQRIGWYSVHVNANDIACMGFQPKYFVVTVMVPTNTTKCQLTQIFDDIAQVCNELDIIVIGGHTEVVGEALVKPIVSGTMLGFGRKDQLIDNRKGPQEGDVVIMTKGFSVEGTAIIASEMLARNALYGLEPQFLEKAQGFLDDPGISVVKDARVLCEAIKVKAMHDVTEGGVLTGLHELADASGKTICVDLDTLNSAMLEETHIICSKLDINPLGLISSGSLLAVVSDDDSISAIEILHSHGIKALIIGRIQGSEPNVIDDSGTQLERFDQDEITKFFS